LFLHIRSPAEVQEFLDMTVVNVDKVHLLPELGDWTNVPLEFFLDFMSPLRMNGLSTPSTFSIVTYCHP
jgi:hypothetical protein